MKNIKFGEYTISDQTPKEGDKVICIQKTNFNYGGIETVTKLQEELKIVDTVNWKVIVEESPVTVDGLIEFVQEHEVVYASSHGRVDKKLTITLAGGYKVYHNKKVVLETMNPSEAVKKYNLF